MFLSCPSLCTVTTKAWPCFKFLWASKLHPSLFSGYIKLYSTSNKGKFLYTLKKKNEKKIYVENPKKKFLRTGKIKGEKKKEKGKFGEKF